MESRAAPAAKNKPPAGRKRAVKTVGNDFSTLLLKAPDTSNPVLLEMKKGALFDVGNVLDQFASLDWGIRNFCDACSEHIGKSK